MFWTHTSRPVRPIRRLDRFSRFAQLTGVPVIQTDIPRYAQTCVGNGRIYALHVEDVTKKLQTTVDSPGESVGVSRKGGRRLAP